MRGTYMKLYFDDIPTEGDARAAGCGNSTTALTILLESGVRLTVEESTDGRGVRVDVVSSMGSRLGIRPVDARTAVVEDVSR